MKYDPNDINCKGLKDNDREEEKRLKTAETDSANGGFTRCRWSSGSGDSEN